MAPRAESLITWVPSSVVLTKRGFLPTCSSTRDTWAGVSASKLMLTASAGALAQFPPACVADVCPTKVDRPNAAGGLGEGPAPEREGGYPVPPAWCDALPR